jgi:hypothetical protein
VAFKRVVEVVVGPKNGTGFSIKDLRIEFKIDKSDSRDPNKGTVKIYNLSNETHEKAILADNHITIKAGYQDETVASICFGDVLRGYRETNGTERITVLEIYDARIAMMGGHVSVSYAKGTAAGTIAQAFLDALGLAYKGLENIPAGEKYEEAFVYMGMATDGLKEVLDRYGLSFTVQNEMVYIMAPGQPAETVGLELTPKSGLLTTPQAVSDKTEEDNVAADPIGKWKFSTMLFPELVPGAACVVHSSTLDGTVRISKAAYEGGNWTGGFKIDIEAVEI